MEPKKPPAIAEQDRAAAIPLLSELAEALQSLKMEKVDWLLEELKQRCSDVKTREALDQLSDEVLIAEYSNAAQICNSLLDVKIKQEQL
jgi:hypothetical protein